MQLFNTLWLLLICISGYAQYQERIMAEANTFIDAFNNASATVVVSYLTPGHYQDEASKLRLESALDEMLPKLTDSLVVGEIIEMVEIGDNIQFVLSSFSGKRQAFILGYLEKKSQEIYFTQQVTSDISRDVLRILFPIVDDQILDVLDPNYHKKFQFELDQFLPIMELSTPNGDKFNLEELKGNLLIINLWSIGCGPCIKEIPSLNELVDEYKNENIDFIAIAAFSDAELLQKSVLGKYDFKWKNRFH